ncbi:integrase arm-type DNA-binding domain-containing protein [Phyllobacterium sp. SB3]|uniref:tyrosine-type recombinase/integrase n=1 Tax=Phyllobacterium sp. SB3 TaxID=3156073 RepID=UPI0032AF39F4
MAARTLNKLTDTECKAVSKVGLLGDGGGLYLNVKLSGAKSWVFIWKNAGKRYEMGLGAYPSVKLAKARLLAADHRQAVAEGRNPIEERKQVAEPTFADCADMFLKSMDSQWRNEKHRAQWRMTLDKYAKPISSFKVSEVRTEEVLKVLKPIWATKSETASRLRGRIERVLDFAKAKGWRNGENPALWRGHLKNILPARQKLTRGHHAAMPYNGIAKFVGQLRVREAMAGKALEFIILTASRSGEVVNATWDEFDLDAKLWTVPAKRMKAGRVHRVPLSERAVEIVKELLETRESDNDYVFSGQKAKRPISAASIDMLMRRMKVDQYTIHGFRSAFRDWSGDETHYPREVAEQALAHTVGDATERAYRRSDALEKRRELMEAWASYCTALPNATPPETGDA